jgi:predicted unusual protein kinase regulating ubiquinone biosynthesis (AarF/ABC1/UbiB family)
MKGPESSQFKRAARMTKLGVSLVGSNLSFALGNLFSSQETRQTRRSTHHEKNARRIRQELQDLRGPAMKLGQVLSMQSHLLDAKAVEELSALQMQAPPMHPTLMRIQFRAEFGKDPEKVFAKFDPEPFAAASLGQVHHATTKEGANVVVKIQYPAVREIIESDFNALSRVMLPARLTQFVPDSVIEELRRGILLECDYRNESRNIQRFGRAMKDIDYVRLPTVFPEFSGERVISMSFVEGVHLDKYLIRKPSQKIRDLAGQRLTELFCFQAYTMHLLHADPHAGNYLFQDDAIGLLDFGCVTELQPDVLQCIRDFSVVRWSEDEGVYRSMLKVIRGPGVSPTDPRPRRTLDEMIRVYRRLYQQDGTPTDFGDPRILAEMTALYKTMIQSKFLSREFLFYSRAEMGLYMLLHRLRARVSTYAIATRAMGI